MRFKYFFKCDKCNTWVRSRSTFYSQHYTSKCISEREAGQVVVVEEVVINDTDLYELSQPAHDDDEEDDGVFCTPVEEDEVAHGDMPSYAETGSLAANLAVEGENTITEEISGLVLKGRKKILKTRKSWWKTYQMLKDTERTRSIFC
jgi:hypothetical protein